MYFSPTPLFFPFLIFHYFITFIAGLLGGRRMIRSGEESGPSTVFIGEEVEAKGEYITVPVKAGL